MLGTLKEVAEQFDEIKMDKEIMDGIPTIQGTRIPVSLILACLKDEMSFKEIKESYNVSEKQIKEAVDYAIEIINQLIRNYKVIVRIFERM